MKKDCRCPKCENQKLYIVEPVSMPDDSSNGTRPITIGAAYIKESETKGWFVGQESATMVSAQCEAYVCASCGYTEWYTTGLDSLEKLIHGPRSKMDVASNSSRVRIVDGTEAGERYR